jgi:Uma2 family endonuclease
MPRVTTIDPIDYAESDGRPMGETDMHRNWIIRLLDIFQWRYRDQRIYVAGDLLVYYEEGNPRQFVVPDLFVVKDCDPGPRRTFKIWEERRKPTLVVEVTSRSSRRQDEQFKPQLYRQLGIDEYVLYDPTGDYLAPCLQGFRLNGEDYEPIVPGPSGEISGRSLGVTFRLEDGQLVLQDSLSGAVLCTQAESEQAAREVEQAARKAAEAACEAERAARQAAEAELQQLREELKRRNRDDGG